jgi:hypothetical protein
VAPKSVKYARKSHIKRRGVMSKATKLFEEITTKIPEYKRCGIYEVSFGPFSDTRKRKYLVESDEVKKKFKGSIRKNICFSGLNRMLKDESLNRVYMAIKNCTTALPKITTKEKKRWIELAQKHKLLPKYINQSWVDKGEYIIDLSTKNMSPSLLYSYLSMIRYNRDEPAFVRSVLIMVDHGVDYYIAFTLASKMYITNSGHHIVDISRSYPHVTIRTTKEILNMELDVGVAISLRRYFNNPGKWDKRSVISEPAANATRWSCNDKIKSTTKISTKTKASNLYDLSVVKAIMSHSDKEANGYLKKLK